MTLTEFLLARIAEDEDRANEASTYTSQRWSVTAGAGSVDVGGRVDIELPASLQTLPMHIAHFDPARVLAECEAKRRIVEARRGPLPVSDDCYYDGLDVAIYHLASVYADHPDFNPEWRP